tara:strand:- start:15193 stop:15624 length:432 start_codon:yes stop_codon:yes gene_type:complete
MAITFNNVIYDRVIDNFHTIIADEFGIQIFYDEHQSNQSFLLQPVSDDLSEEIHTGMVRNYTILISYQVDFAGNYTKESFRQVSLVAERMKRLIYNNRNYTVSNARQFYNAVIDNTIYERDEDNTDLLRANMTVVVSAMEIIG